MQWFVVIVGLLVSVGLHLVASYHAIACECWAALCGFFWWGFLCVLGCMQWTVIVGLLLTAGQRTLLFL